tara:strand:+ start:69 stop:551 length:483 start_codon:yes stop_codon:yes gene_type:complete
VNIVSNSDVIADTHHTCEGAVFTDNGTATNTTASSKRRALSNPHVVCQVHLIIQNSVVLNDRVLKGTSIDRATSANLNTVPNSDTAHLQYLHPAIFRGCKAEAISAYRRIAVNNTVITNHDTVVQNGIGVQACVTADLSVLSYIDTGTYHGAIADNNTLF